MTEGTDRATHEHRDAPDPRDSTPAGPSSLLPLTLALVAGVIAPLLAAWGEAGGPEGGLEGVAYGLACLIGWPAVVLGPGLVGATQTHRRGGSVGLAGVLWTAVNLCLVGLGLLTGFAISCDGTCLS